MKGTFIKPKLQGIKDPMLSFAKKIIAIKTPYRSVSFSEGCVLADVLVNTHTAGLSSRQCNDS